MPLPDYTSHQWRNSGLSARLGLFFTSLDARVFLFFIIFLVHISWTTFYISVAAIVFFSVLEYYGFGIGVAWRRVRSYIAGRKRVVQKIMLRRRRFINV